MTRLLSQKFLTAAFVGSLASLTVGLLWILAPALFASWEWSTYDVRLRLRGPAPVSTQLLIIGRDNASDARFGKGIWNRAIIARMVAALGQAGAAVVAPDFHFAGESPPERGGAASDYSLVEATRATATLYPVSLTLAGSERRTGPAELNPGDQELLLRESPALSTETIGALIPAVSVHTPLPALMREARGLGHIAALSDEDGVYRRVPAYVNLNGRPFPAFGVAIAAAYLRVTSDRIAVIPGKALIFRLARPPDGASAAGGPTISLPIDPKGQLLVDYAGSWADGLFPYLSFVDVWDAVQEGRLDELRKHVTGKIVLLSHAATEADKRLTPLETTAPGGFIHANVVNTILTGRSLRPVPVAGQGFITVALAIGGAWLLLSGSGWKRLGYAAGLAGGYVALAQGALAGGGLVLPMLAPLFALALALGTASVMRYLVEERSRLWMHDAFSRYLGPVLVGKLADNHTALRLGGERGDVTVMFADLSGFLKLSTQVPPEVLTRVTNRYLSVIVEQVEATGGYVNQFLGDCVMALWGALSPDPHHAVNGVRAAMAAAIRIDRERRDAEAMGEFGFAAKIGLNSGPVIVGNIGTDQRYNYTAVGETVNIAARIETVAGLYACPVAIGPLTAELVRQEFLVRELDAVKVPGKDDAIAVFEPLAERARATAQQVECAQRYAEALARYRAMRFAEAADLWDALARIEQERARAHNGQVLPGNPSSKMAARARAYVANPPVSSWDGAWVLSEK